jgi:nucleotide-binding universal stress UspA family protein
VEEIVAQGTPANEILKLADEESSGLIVVGLGGGSKARDKHPAAPAVAREARCPVLFVHAEPAGLSLQPDPALETGAGAKA